MANRSRRSASCKLYTELDEEDEEEESRGKKFKQVILFALFLWKVKRVTKTILFISAAKRKKEEPVARGSGGGKMFMRKHLDSKSGHPLTQEEMVPINIKPTEGGMCSYPLAYPLDFKLLDMCFL